MESFIETHGDSVAWVCALMIATAFIYMLVIMARAVLREFKRIRDGF